MINFTGIFISRPRLVVILNLFIFIIGVIVFTRLDINTVPKVDSTSISVTFSYKQSSPFYMEKQIVTPAENELKGLTGLEEIMSRSEPGRASIIMKFSPQTNIDQAVSDVKARLKIYRLKLQCETSI